MINAVFYRKNGLFFGFSVSGHAYAGDYGHDIVCAGVSSAVMLTINTVTDFLSADASIRSGGNIIALKLSNPQGDVSARACIFSLMEHLKQLSDTYGNIAVTVKDLKKGT